MRPLRLLHVLSQRPDATGSGIYLQAMLNEAHRNGYTNALVAGIQADWPADLTGIETRHSRFVQFGSAQFPEAIVGMSDVMPYNSRRFKDLDAEAIERYEAAFTDQIQTAVAAFQPDLIHSHHLWLVTALTRRLFPHIPMVTSCHGSDLRQFRNCPHLRDRVQPCRDLDAVLALGRTQKREIENTYGIEAAKVHVVGAGYDEQRFRMRAKPTPDPVRLLYAGKLSRAKGVPWLLRALRGMAAPAWHLDLVGGGSGAEKAECLQLAEALGRRVTIHGALSQAQLADLLQQAHIFVLPSFFEGLPLVLLEALACGCRAVTTRLPGVGELMGGVESKAVTLVELPRLEGLDKPHPDDGLPFERALEAALATQIRAVQQHGADSAQNLRPEVAIADRLRAFTWPQVFARIEALYQAVADRTRRDTRIQREA